MAIQAKKENVDTILILSKGLPGNLMKIVPY